MMTNRPNGASHPASALRAQPVQLRSATWRFVAKWLAHASDSEMTVLGLDRDLSQTDSASAWGEVASRLLVLSGAWRHANLMTGTVIALDTDLVLTSEGAAELARESATIELRIIGGRARRHVRRQKLLSVLLAGTEVDQLD